MLDSEVLLGSCYQIRLNGKFTVVRLMRPLRRGWVGWNLRTGRAVFVKSASKLRERVSDDRLAELAALYPDVVAMRGLA